MQEHKEQKVPDGKDVGADKDGDGDKMEGESIRTLTEQCPESLGNVV